MLLSKPKRTSISHAFRFEIRRVPRTKSLFERQSSRRYSSLDYDLNGYYEHRYDEYVHSQENEDLRQNQLNFIDAYLRQTEENGFGSMNGIENYDLILNGDDENEE